MPFFLVQVAVETTIGFIKEVDDIGISGFNVYHKNRLIRVCSFNYLINICAL